MSLSLKKFTFRVERRIISLSVFLIMLVGCGGGSGDTNKQQEVTIPPVQTDPLGSLYTDASTNLPSGIAGRCMAGAASDVDNDNDLDLILAIENGRNVLLTNDGSAKFTNSDVFSELARDSEDVAVEDFDNDGDLDVIFVSEDDFVNEFYLNNGDGSFTDASSRIPVDGISNAVVTFDINNDGFNDIIIGNNGLNFVLLNTGDANFEDETANIPVGSNITQDIEAVDIDNDGDLDLAMGNETFNQIFINNGNGSFTEETSSRLTGIFAETRDLEFGDIDNDGDLDLLASNVMFFDNLSDKNTLLINDGNGVFSEDVSISIFGNHVDSALVDLDRDGDLDIVTGTSFLSDQVGQNQGFVNDGTGAFSAVSFPGQGNLFDIVVADFNGDNKVDLFFCNRQTSAGGGEDSIYLAE